MGLTDAKLRDLKGQDSPYKVADGEGLYVLVPPKGSRLWRLVYRYLGKQKTLALGAYPQMTLLEARRARDEAKKQIAVGADPSAARKKTKREKLVSAGNTFEAVANEWFALNESRWVKTYASRLRSRLDDDLDAYCPSVPNVTKRLAYDDPPYSKLQYSRYYHVLNVLLDYDYPVVAGAGLYPPKEKRFSSKFEYQPGMAKKEFDALFRAAAAKMKLVVSYSNSGFVGRTELIELAKKNFERIDILSERVRRRPPGRRRS